MHSYQQYFHFRTETIQRYATKLGYPHSQQINSEITTSLLARIIVIHYIFTKEMSKISLSLSLYIYIQIFPQVLLNWRRKSAEGLSLEYVILNFTKYSAYLFYNIILHFSKLAQQQYNDHYHKYDSTIIFSCLCFMIHQKYTVY